MNIKRLGKAIGAGLRKNAPKICIGAGIAAGIAAIVTTGIQSTKLSDIIDEANEEMDKRQEAVDEGKKFKDEDGKEQEYTQEVCDADKRKVYFRTAVKIAKLYAIPACLAIGSIVLVCCGAHILSVRLAAETAAYNGAVAAMKAAKSRCEEVCGKEKTEEIFSGLKKTGEYYDVIEKDADGNEKKVKKPVYETDENGVDNRFSFIFSKETSPMWSASHMYNQKLFSFQENDLNTMLDLDGAVKLSDALKKFRILPPEDNNMTDRDGWLHKEFGGMDGYIQVTATLIDPATETYRLEFNVDGDISDKYAKALWARRNHKHSLDD